MEFHFGAGDAAAATATATESFASTPSSHTQSSNHGQCHHTLYREQYFALKAAFVPAFLECVVLKRGDIDYLRTCGHDVDDTFFMRIAPLKQTAAPLDFHSAMQWSINAPFIERSRATIRSKSPWLWYPDIWPG